MACNSFWLITCLNPIVISSQYLSLGYLLYHIFQTSQISRCFCKSKIFSNWHIKIALSLVVNETKLNAAVIQPKWERKSLSLNWDGQFLILGGRVRYGEGIFKVIPNNELRKESISRISEDRIAKLRGQRMEYYYDIRLYRKKTNSQ